MATLVREAMTPAPQTVDVSTTASEAALLMRSEDVGSLPVLKDGLLLGLVTDRDLVLRVLAEARDPMSVQVGELATMLPVTIGPEEKLSAARDAMEQYQIRRLPVTENGELVGIISLGDVAEESSSARQVGKTLRAVSEPDS